jgi:hypothetical protein
MRDVLALAAVPAEVWPRAEEAWGERLLDDLEADGALSDALDASMVEAQKRWLRPLPPLDVDLRAWLDFERAWAFEVDGDAFLAERQMRPSDMTRLRALWSERQAQDPALQARALALLAEEPGPLRAPRPGPARLPTSDAGVEAATDAPETRRDP